MKLKGLDYLLIPTGWNEQRKKRADEELKRRKVGKVLILDKHNSEEDILYLGKKLRGGERIGFVTFPLHYEEYKEIIRKVIKQGDFPKNVKTENVATGESAKQFIYGGMGLMEEKLKKGKIDYLKNKPVNYFISKLREIVKRFLAR